MPNKINHRPLGSGAETIRVKRRTDQTASPGTNPGCVIFIGRALWAADGLPERVSISRETPGFYRIKAVSEGGYKVSGMAQDGMPRISVGGPTIEALHLPEGIYEASAGATSIQFKV